MSNLFGGLGRFALGQSWLPRNLLTPALVGMLGAAIVVTLFLYTTRPQVTRRTVIALLPWMLLGAGLSVLGSTVDFPSALRPAVTGSGAYLTVYTALVIVWFGTIQFARGGQPVDRLPTYLGSTGAGALTVVGLVLLLHAGSITRTELFWLIFTPIIAVVVAGLVLLLLGLWYPEAAAYTGMAGGFVVFSHAMAAIATTVAVISGGPHSTLSFTLQNALEAADAASLLGIPSQVIWAGGFIWLRLMLATAAIVALSMYTRNKPNRGNLALGVIAAIGVVGGSTTLLSLVVGG